MKSRSPGLQSLKTDSRSSRTSDQPGRAAKIIIWGATGPLFGCSDIWQLVTIPELLSSLF